MPGVVGIRPWFTQWKPRVFRLAALRPGTALCTRMKGDGLRTQRQRPKRSDCSLEDGVAAGAQCQTQAISVRAGREGLCLVSRAVVHPLFPLLQLTARPIPSRIVAQDLIYLLHATLAAPGELLPLHKRTFGTLHHLTHSYAAAALSCIAANMSYSFILYRLCPCRRTPRVAGPVSVRRKSVLLPYWLSPHINFLFAALPIYRRPFVPYHVHYLAETCSAFQAFCPWYNWTVNAARS